LKTPAAIDIADELHSHDQREAIAERNFKVMKREEKKSMVKLDGVFATQANRRFAPLKKLA